MSGRLVKKCILLAIASIAMLPNCSFVAPKAQEEDPYFADIGEGYTAASESGGIDVAGAGRIVSAPDAIEFCQKAPRPAKLVAPKDVVLHVFESFPFDRLKVLAVDASGRLLPPVPISLTTDDTGCLMRVNAILAQAGSWVVPIRTGRFRFRVGTMCNTPEVSVEIHAAVEGRREEPYLGPIAEGYTSASAMRTGIGGLPEAVFGGIDAAFGRFSASGLPEICAKSPRPAKLVALTDPAVLDVGIGFYIKRLKVLAMDESGTPLPPVPIMVQVDDTSCFIATRDVLARAGNWVIPIRAGRFRFRVKTICEHIPQASVEIQADVLDEMNVGLPSSTEETR